jgi:hypothetical protein
MSEDSSSKGANLVNLVETAVATLIRELGSDWLKAGALAFGLVLPLMPVIQTAYVGFAITVLVMLWLLSRGEVLADFGLIVPTKWLRYIGYGLLVTFADLAWSILAEPAIDGIIVDLTGANPDQAAQALGMVRGNLNLFLFVLPFIWIFGAFGEEFFYRGYLMTRLERLFGGGRIATATAIVLQGVIFGLGHAYQGPVGMVGVALSGMIYGIGARLFGRNLWPAMIAHGLIDMLGFTLLYLGVMKG